MGEKTLNAVMKQAKFIINSIIYSLSLCGNFTFIFLELQVCTEGIDFKEHLLIPVIQQVNIVVYIHYSLVIFWKQHCQPFFLSSSSYSLTPACFWDTC